MCACLLIFCACVFGRWIALPAIARGGLSPGRTWSSVERGVLLVSVVVAALSGVAWFVLIAAEMSDLPVRQAMRVDVLKDVWNETLFGTLWKIRLLLWLATSLCLGVAELPVCPSRLRTASGWLALFLSACFAGALAWAGHGQTGQRPLLHLSADVLHILLTGLWPIGLVPLALMLIRLRRDPSPGRPIATAELLRRFSAMSLATVALLTLTGIINSWVLVGSFHNLVATRYGRVLLVKIALFGLLVALGAINLLYVRPRLSAASMLAPPRQRRVFNLLQANVAAEIVVATIVMMIVGILGLMPPAME
jgi:putative copper resistance protein D